jgi:hypothetical protein
MNTKIKDERNTMKNGKLNGKVAVVTGASVFLASSDSAWITGETLRVAGGLR